MPEPTASPDSDPRQLLEEMISRGAGNSPDAIMLRLLWLRQEHPDARVATEVVHLDGDRIAMRATIVLGYGAAGSGIAAAVAGDDDDWAGLVERTETTAISRALDTLGYVLRAAREPGQPAPREEAPEPAPGSDTGPQAVSAARQPRPEPAPVPEQPRPEPESRPRSSTGRIQEAAPPVVNALRRVPRQATPEPPAPEATADPDNIHLEEYSWNSFWKRAREIGLDPSRITELLGRPANSMTPREAVEALIEAGAWPAPGAE